MAAASAVPVLNAAVDPVPGDVRIGVASYSFREFSRSLAIKGTKALNTPYLCIKEFHALYRSTPEELDKAKSYIKGSYALTLDTSSKIAAQLVQIQTDNLGIDYIQRRSAMIDAVTLDDAKRVAKRLYGSGMLVSIAGEPKGVASSE